MDTNVRRVADAAAVIENFSEKIKEVPGLKAYVEEIRPWSPTDIASVESGLSITLAADVRFFLTRGLRQLRGSNKGGEHFSVGFDFCDADTAVSNTEMLREIATSTLGDVRGGRELIEIISTGVAITYEEPCLVVGPKGVYHFSVSNDLLAIAGSFVEFLEAYAASGCFKAGAFRAWWSLIESSPPLPLPPSKNQWVTSYEATYR